MLYLILKSDNILKKENRSSMKISKINIENSFTKFIDEQEIIIPNNKETNCVFIYGKNGSGKSSISKLFVLSNKCIDKEEYADDILQLKTKKSIKELDVKVYYDNGNTTNFKANNIINPVRIPVFNQNYIDTKITYQEDFKSNKFKENNVNYGVELESKTKYFEKLKIVKMEQKTKEELEEKINQKISSSMEEIKKDTTTKDSNKNYAMFTLEKLKLIQEIPDIQELNAKRLEHIKYIQQAGYTIPTE